MKAIYFLFALIVATILNSCWGIQTGKPLNKIAPGEWRGVFMLDQQHKDRVPLVFHVLTDKEDKTIGLSFINGSDSTVSDSIRFWGDTLYVYFAKQERYMKLVYEVNLMEGFLYCRDSSVYPMVFQAQNGAFPRFPDVRRPPTHDINGLWKMQLAGTGDSISVATLDLKIRGNHAEAKFIQQDKIAINIEGSLQGNQLFMSGFDGKNVVMLSALATTPQSLQKGTLSINYDKSIWAAEK